MSEDKGFLSRWARRKAQAGQQQDVRTAPAPGELVPGTAAAIDKPDALPFDLDSLPSLDSLTAASDLTAFMRAGVPETLRNAALRQMWVTDPGIRDYIGLADYDWDFNTPGALAGHGELAAGTDIGKLVAQFTNQMAELVQPEVEPDPATALDMIAEASAEAPLLAAPDADLAADMSIRNDAPEPPVAAAPWPARRRHGGAVPR